MKLLIGYSKPSRYSEETT